MKMKAMKMKLIFYHAILYPTCLAFFWVFFNRWFPDKWTIKIVLIAGTMLYACIVLYIQIYKSRPQHFF